MFGIYNMRPHTYVAKASVVQIYEGVVCILRWAPLSPTRLAYRDNASSPIQRWKYSIYLMHDIVKCSFFAKNTHNMQVVETFCGHTDCSLTVTQLCQANNNEINVGSSSADETNPMAEVPAMGPSVVGSLGISGSHNVCNP